MNQKRQLYTVIGSNEYYHVKLSLQQAIDESRDYNCTTNFLILIFKFQSLGFALRMKRVAILLCI